MKNNILIYLIIIQFILNIVMAQPQDQNFCVDSDKSCSTDISTIPPDNIDVSRVIASGRGNELTVQQIKANLDKFDNLNVLDLDRVSIVMEELYGVHISDFGQSSSLKNGVLRATFGKQNSVTLTNDLYRNGFLKITENGEIIFVPSSETKNLPIP